jgi:outer membrane protein assembly factor BamD (BamD/ComL family)
MGSTVRLLSAILAGLALGACAGTGASAVPAEATPAELLANARSLADAGDVKGARTLYERIVDDHPTAPEFSEASWQVAEMNYRLEEWSRAKEAYEDYNDLHPLGNLSELEDRMYEVGRNLYLEGSSGLLGLGIFTSLSPSRETMTFIAEKLDSGSRADDALLFLGKTSILEYKNQVAADFLELLLERYPESEWALEARYYRGWAYWLENRGAPYDLASLLKARGAFQDYLRVVERDPARRTEYSERIAEVRQNVSEVEATLAEKNVLIARFYLSQERPEAARPYLERTVRDYPETEGAGEARELLGEAGAGE